MDYEFKLFAGLTLKQFIYVAVSGGFAFGLYELNRAGVFPAFFAWLTIPTIILVGVTLGLGSFNKRTMEDWFTSFARANTVALRRVWKKETTPIKFEQFFNTKPKVLPTYLATYFMNADAFRKLMKMPAAGYGYPQNTTVVQAQEIPQITPVISINQQNFYDYAEPGVSLPAIPNTVAFKLQEDGIPTEGVVAYVKDPQSTVIAALRSNKDGIIYFNQGFANGEFEVDFQSPDAATYPKVKIQFEGTTYPLLNLTPVA